MFVVVVMIRQRLQQVKLCQTFDEAVQTAMGVIEQWEKSKEKLEVIRNLLITRVAERSESEACFASGRLQRSVHIGEL